MRVKVCHLVAGAIVLFASVPGLLGASPAPLLTVALTVTKAQGKTFYRASVKDAYSSPATEFVITTRYLLPSSYPCRPVQRAPNGGCLVMSAVHRWMVPGHRGSPGHPLPGSWVVPAGQMVTVGETEQFPGAVAPQITCTAVIYEDGAMAGNPTVLRMLLLERQEEYGDAAWAVKLLQQAAAAPSADLGAMAAQFQARVATHRGAWSQRFKDWHGPIPAHMAGADPACRSLGNELRQAAKGNLSAQGASQRLTLVLRNARAWLDLLAHSRPALQPPSL